MTTPPIEESTASGRIFIDVSGYRQHFKRRVTPTGIQRTIAMIASKSAERLGAENVFLGYFDSQSGAYLVVPIDEEALSQLKNTQYLAELLGVDQDSYRLKQLRRKYSGRPIANILHRLRLRYLRAIGDGSYFAQHGVDIRKLGRVLTHQPIEGVIRKTDVILLMDAGWDVPQLEAVMSPLKERGVKIISFIHDVIPISHPHFVSQEASNLFSRWLKSTTQYTTKYVANSLATAAELKEVLREFGVTTDLKAVPLAQERLPKCGRGSDELPDAIRKSPSFHKSTDAPRAVIGKPYVLFVGSRDIRKNLFRLAQAWQILLDRDQDAPVLVVAGSAGGGNQDFDRLMQATANLNGKVVVVDAPSDGDLDALYQDCLFTVFPSLFEGWGLPIGESLSYGKCVITSAAGSMPEVAGNCAIYCDPMSVDSIVAAVQSLLKDEKLRLDLEATIEASHLRTWDEVCAELLTESFRDATAESISHEHSNPTLGS